MDRSENLSRFSRRLLDLCTPSELSPDSKRCGICGGNSFIAGIDKNIKGTRKTYGVPNLAYVCGYECVQITA